MLGVRPLLLVSSTLLVASAAMARAQAAEPAAPGSGARYALEARIDDGTGRFALRDAEISAKAAPTGPRFALLAATPKGATLCAVDDTLFADGFED